MKVTKHILELLACIRPEVVKIIVVDGACPYSSGALVRKSSKDKRVEVIISLSTNTLKLRCLSAPIECRRRNIPIL